LWATLYCPSLLENQKGKQWLESHRLPHCFFVSYFCRQQRTRAAAVEAGGSHTAAGTTRLAMAGIFPVAVGHRIVAAATGITAPVTATARIDSAIPQCAAANIQ
jgi:hypothetical protein